MYHSERVQLQIVDGTFIVAPVALRTLGSFYIPRSSHNNFNVLYFIFVDDNASFIVQWIFLFFFLWRGESGKRFYLLAYNNQRKFV